MKVYVATSWRNPHQPGVVAALRAAGHDVYDFRNPRPGAQGFTWSDLDGGVPGVRSDGGWQRWTPAQFREALKLPRAKEGFDADMDALRDCDACVLVLPCGRSSHLELGWAAGAGKLTFILMLGREEPELMYRMVHGVCLSVAEVVDALSEATWTEVG